MKIVNVQQGSPEWKTLRARYHTASEAPALMGASPNTSRSELMRMKASGSEEEVSRWVQEVLFAGGHQVEAAARPIAEGIVGEDLYPATGVDDDDGPLLASFDGITMLEDVIWECKQWNAEKVKVVRDDQVPEVDYWQLVHQFAVSGAERALYMVTDGTKDGTVSTWVEPDRDAIKKLRKAWAQFDQDLATYEPPQDDGPAPAGNAPEQLPALRVEVRGEVTATNINEFKEHAQSVIADINTDLQTDEDFADAEKTVKWAKEVETRLDAAKEQALAQTEDLDRLFRTMDEVRELARSKRLELQKLVEARKQAVREEIIAERQRTLADMVSTREKELGVSLGVGANFAAAIKGKKTVKTVREAADQEMADAKLRLQEETERIHGNLERLRELVGDQQRLFPDWRDLVRKAGDDMEAQVRARISEEKERERKRAEAERERIRQEEERKAEEQRRLEAEHERVREEAQQSVAEKQEQPAENGQPAEQPEPKVEASAEPTVVSELEDDGARITLGGINQAIAPLSISAAGLAEIGFEPVDRQKTAKLYRAADLPRICQVLIQRLQKAATHNAREAA